MANLRTLTDSLVQHFVGYTGGSLVVLADESSLEIGQSIVDSGNAVDGASNVDLIDVDTYRRGNPLTTLPDGLREEIAAKLRGSDLNHNTVLYVIESLEGETRLE